MSEYEFPKGVRCTINWQLCCIVGPSKHCVSCTWSEKIKKCPECKGKGMFEADHYGKQPCSCDWAPVWCRTCKGKGAIPDPKGRKKE